MNTSFISWLARTPLLRGVRSSIGKFIQKGIEAKYGVILYYPEINRAKILSRIREIKRDTKMLLHDSEAMMLYETVQALRHVPGDIGEVGTYRGGSAAIMAEACGGQKAIHTFDTFEGLPPVADFDAQRFSTGQFATPVEAVRQFLAPYPNIHIYEGLFPDAAPPIASKTFSFVHLDVDLYQGTYDGLAYFYPRLVKGGVIMSHDYSNAEGVRRAFAEFFSDKPETVFNLPGTQCLVVKG